MTVGVEEGCTRCSGATRSPSPSACVGCSATFCTEELLHVMGGCAPSVQDSRPQITRYSVSAHRVGQQRCSLFSLSSSLSLYLFLSLSLFGTGTGGNIGPVDEVKGHRACHEYIQQLSVSCVGFVSAHFTLDTWSRIFAEPGSTVGAGMDINKLNNIKMKWIN